MGTPGGNEKNVWRAEYQNATQAFCVKSVKSRLEQSCSLTRSRRSCLIHRMTALKQLLRSILLYHVVFDSYTVWQECSLSCLPVTPPSLAYIVSYEHFIISANGRPLHGNTLL